MDFFAAQDRARRRTWMLIIPAVMALLVLIFLAYFLVVLCWWFFYHHRDGQSVMAVMEEFTKTQPPQFRWWHPQLFWMTAISATIIIGGGSILQIIELGKQGGNFIAHRLGAKTVRYDTTDFEERRLINIVEELSIASGVRVPELFILEEDGINSFCAGHDVDSAVLIITRGAVDVLNRDELQAILAHEFSHILNADMIINTRLVGVLHGFLMFTVMGQNLLIARGWFMIAGGALLVLGYAGKLLGVMIQAMICRQREWLADAHAIQFTRNPDAIVSALKKIGGYHYSSYVPRPFAIESAHMFFANAIEKRWFLRTHPPLANRIRAISPGFSGVFLSVAPTRKATGQTIYRVEKFYREAERPKLGDYLQRYAGALTLPGMASDTLMRDKHGVSWGTNVHWPAATAPEEVVTRISAGAGNPLFAAAIIEGIDVALREAVRDPARARLVLFGLLCDEANQVAQVKQREIVARVLQPGEQAGFAEMRAKIANMPAPLRLPLADLALPALKVIPPVQLDTFVRTITELIVADGRVSLYEYALRHIVVRQLRPVAGPTHVEMNATSMAGSIGILLSAMAHAGAETPGAALAAFSEGKKYSAAGVRDRLQLAAESALGPGVITMALSHTERAAPLIKKDILAALARVASQDGVVKPAEQELLRAVAAALNCPAPVLG